jgi:ABC-2 type transport system ATP-binding protein
MSSHVLAVVQHAADRVGIVRQGRLVAVERVESLAKRDQTARRTALRRCGTGHRLQRSVGVTELVVDGPVVRFTVEGKLDALIKAAARHTVVDLISTEPDLEGTFLSSYYAPDGEHHAA